MGLRLFLIRVHINVLEEAWLFVNHTANQMPEGHRQCSVAAITDIS